MMISMEAAMDTATAVAAEADMVGVATGMMIGIMEVGEGKMMIYTITVVG